MANYIMSNFTQPYTMKGFWIDVPDLKDKDPCEADVLQLALTINSQIYSKSHASDTYGFAKAICRELEPYVTRWQVQVLQTVCAKKFDTIKKTYPKAREEDLNPPRKKEFLVLITAIKEVIHAIEANPNEVLKPSEIERKLRKLIIYLLLTPSWPYPYREDRNSIDKVVAVFVQYKQLFANKELISQNQGVFNKFVSELNKHLHRHAMTLEELSAKIVTKSNRALPEGLILFDQVKDLIKRGTERILWTDQPDHKAVLRFCRVFSNHAYVYKPNPDNNEAELQLQRAVDRLVEILVAYDRQNDSSTLFNFMNELMQEIKYLIKRLDSNPHMNLPRIASLVWTFKALVGNAECIQYMRPAGREQDISQLVMYLFSKEQTWQPINDYVVFLGNAQLFREMLTPRIDTKQKVCTLSERQVNLIFRNLNLQLANEENVSYRDSYKRMYLSFLQLLASVNKLHFLKPYANHPEYQVQLRANLIMLDYSFMDDGARVPLDTFFGNPTLRALHFQKIPHGVHIRKTLVNLFTKLGENPVESNEDFERILLDVIDDFYQELEILCEEVLSQIGRSAAPGVEKTVRRGLIPVENWLSATVIPIYRSLKVYITKCLPLKWKETTFNGAENLIERLCLHEGQLYIIDYHEGQFILHDPFDKAHLAQCPDTVLYSDLLGDVKAHIKRELQVQAHREAVSFLTEAYMSFNHHEKIKETLESLLSIVFKKMVGESSATFKERILIVANFLQVLSPFFKKLDSLVEARFFRDGKLRVNIVLNLIDLAKGYGEVGQTLRNLKNEDDIALKEDVVRDVSQLVGFLCIEDIKDILQRCSLTQLVQATSQFENVICRKVDELSYLKEDFIKSFCEYEGNRSQFPDSDLQTILGDLAIKENIIKDFGDFLKKRPIPVHFILPNQALAARLCTCEAFNERNLLVKLGTGQGKSIVIAVAALHEARRIKDHINGKVFVFTSYDHLAKRDHELGENFFKKEGIKSICISTIADISRFNEQIKIIYADIENIDGIVREIMLKLIENKASSAEKAFIKTIYGTPNEEIRIILDEYDLLLYDLERKQPFVESIPSRLLDVHFVRSNQEYWPSLASWTRVNSEGKNSRAIDPSSGKEYRTVSFYDSAAGFHLYVSVMRLSKLIQRAKRVIGLSGTALQGESHNLINPLYFELPSSQNPEVFGTKIQEGKAPLLTDQAYIACHQERQLETPGKEGSTLLISTSAIQEYCDTIIADIRAVKRSNPNYERPILIFGDLLVNYKTPGSGNLPKTLWKTLEQAIREAGINLHVLTKDVSDADLQMIARSGKVTLTTIKYGRGADIRVSLDIEEGLHVIVAVPVIHKRLLHQLIGRTGRMGRQGSYSAITLGSLIDPSSDQASSSTEFYSALHEITKFFVNKLTSSQAYNTEDCKKWLMFLSNAYNSKRISKVHTQRLCGGFFEERSELDGFYF